MHKLSVSRERRGSEARVNGFTLIELLIVMSIIIVLAGLILATSQYVQKKGYRSRAEAEIAAISAALESYKADNGVYPRGNAVSAPGDVEPFDTDNLDARTNTDPSTYGRASLFLYECLMADPDADGGTDGKSYMQLKPNQIGRANMAMPASATNKVTGVRDPFGNNYGYSTAYQHDPTKGYNPTFDLWSTADPTPTPSAPTPTPQDHWIKNW